MPIARFAEGGAHTLTFPQSHSMGRWRSYGKESIMPKLGRFGDVVDFATLPESVRTTLMAEEFGAVATLADDAMRLETLHLAEDGSHGEWTEPRNPFQA